MAVIPSDIAQPFIRRESIVGPVTSARHRRNAMIYAAMCILGLLPTHPRHVAGDAGMRDWVYGFPAADSSPSADGRSCSSR